MKDPLEKSPLAPRVLIALSLLLLTGAYALFFNYALSTENAIEYEGPCLWAASRLAHGANPYPAKLLTESPFSVIIYPPVYFLFSSLFLHQGLSYLPMRLISIFSTMLTAVFYYFFLRFYGLKKINCLSGTAFLLSFMAIWLWSAKARVDMLSIALSAAALCLYSLARKRKFSAALLCCSAMTMALATLTKQPAALLALAVQSDCALQILFLKQNKVSPNGKNLSGGQKQLLGSFVAFGVSFLAALSIGILTAEHLTGGGFIAHMHFAAHMPFFAQYLVERLNLMAIDLPKVLLAALSAVLISVQCLKQRRTPALFSLSLLMLAFTVPTTFYTAGTHYSNVNHFLTALFAIPALIALAVDCLGKNPQNEHATGESSKQATDLSKLALGMNKLAISWSYLSSATLFISSILLAFLGFTLFGPSAKTRQPALSAPIPQAKIAEICPKNRAILAEDAGIACLTGLTSEPVDITTFIQVLGLSGKQSDMMLTHVKERGYGAVIINHKEFTGERDAAQWRKEIIEAVKDNYNYFGQTSGNGEMHDIYLPKSK